MKDAKTKYSFVQSSDKMWAVMWNTKYLVYGIDGEVRWKYEKNITIDDLVYWRTIQEAIEAFNEVLKPAGSGSTGKQ